ncbi:unnamed protein product [Protopolystoma xenopodis]|uniref:MCM C-terminal AAA(+) ATPase domain-containing protein n=1 Tax=Protopolystoma xenopodis TaxID=117903 RepID=A0A3S5A7F1_9PLAT|nr:unnamed protein product [Protopolystoma xenopodis]
MLGENFLNEDERMDFYAEPVHKRRDSLHVLLMGNIPLLEYFLSFLFFPLINSHFSEERVTGDPGIGKSQLLRAVTSIAPRSVYVCGNSATSAGLTVSTTRTSSASGGFGLEAGALVLADRGCCCLDEFDKLPTHEPDVLLEAMEQQTISLARGGVVASLPARVTLIAAANPVGGHYDLSRRLQANIRLPDALLSRYHQYLHLS